MRFTIKTGPAHPPLTFRDFLQINKKPKKNSLTKPEDYIPASNPNLFRNSSGFDLEHSDQQHLHIISP